MARWLMYHLRHRFPAGIVITGTKLNDFWAEVVPQEFIHDVEDIDAVLDRVYARQAFIIQNAHLGIDPRFFVILDDVLKEKYKVRFSKALSRAFTGIHFFQISVILHTNTLDGRHYKVFTLITTQDPRYLFIIYFINSVKLY